MAIVALIGYICGAVGHFEMINLKNISRREAYVRSLVWFLIIPFLGFLVIVEKGLGFIDRFRK